MTKPDDAVYVHTPKEGLFVTGIPARDLTQRDVDRLGEARIAKAVATGLYKAKKAAPAASRPASAGEGTER